MLFWRTAARLLCTWFTCVAIGLLAAPAGTPRLSVLTEQCAEAQVERDEHESASEAECTSAAPAHEPELAAARLLLPVATRRPRLATDHTVRRAQLYIHHCALLC